MRGDFFSFELAACCLILWYVICGHSSWRLKWHIHRILNNKSNERSNIVFCKCTTKNSCSWHEYLFNCQIFLTLTLFDKFKEKGVSREKLLPERYPMALISGCKLYYHNYCFCFYRFCERKLLCKKHSQKFFDSKNDLKVILDDSD